MSNLCIIPARGGSKRIPRKNIKDFLGKPIIAYSIETAIASGMFDEVMVSTDDNEIADLAVTLGAKVPFKRSEQNSNDFATTFDVIEEVWNSYSNMGNVFNNICCIYPCAPFITADNLKKAFDLMNADNFDSVFPVVQFSFPIQRAISVNNNKLRFFYPEFELSRSQDLEKSYHDAGQFYWLKSASIIESKGIVTSNTGTIILSEMETQDIDTDIDWKLAELKYKLLK